MAVREVDEMMAIVEELEEVVTGNLVKRLRAAAKTQPDYSADGVGIHPARRDEMEKEMATWTGPDGDVDVWTPGFLEACNTLANSVAGRMFGAKDADAKLEKVRTMAQKLAFGSSGQVATSVQTFQLEFAAAVVVPATMAHAELKCFMAAHLLLQRFHSPWHSVSDALSPSRRKGFFEDVLKQRLVAHASIVEHTEAYRKAKLACVTGDDEFLQCAQKLCNLVDVLHTRMNDAEKALDGVK